MVECVLFPVPQVSSAMRVSPRSQTRMALPFNDEVIVILEGSGVIRGSF